jgi:stalled ribosome rescue protein Dom34
MAKNLGIFMDHSTAHIIEFSADVMESKTLELAFTHQEKLDTLVRSEHIMHNKEQHQQAAYYKKLGEIIRNYDEVILFGPTEAKVELLNTLKADHLFANIKIEIAQTDKMTENQQHAFVKAHFSPALSH